MDPRDTLTALRANRSTPCVTVVAPLRVPSRAAYRKSLCDEARRALVERGVRTREIETWIDHLAAALEATSEEGATVVVWSAPGLLHRQVLPYDAEALVAVSDRTFRVEALLRWITDRAVTALVLEAHHVRLLHCSRYAVRAIPIADAPASLDDLERDRSPSRRQVHTVGAPGGISAGHGGGRDRHQNDLADFCRAVDAAVVRATAGSGEPLVLVADDRIASIYRSVTRHPDLLPEAVHHVHPAVDEDVHRLVVEAAAARLGEPVRDDHARFLARVGTGHATREVDAISAAAEHGKIEALLVGPRAGGEAVSAAILHTLATHGRLHLDPAAGDEMLALLRS